MQIIRTEEPIAPENVSADVIASVRASTDSKNVDVISVFRESLRCLACAKKNNMGMFGDSLVDILTMVLNKEFLLPDHNRTTLLRHQTVLNDFRIKMDAEYDAMTASFEADLRQYVASIQEASNTANPIQ